MTTTESTAPVASRVQCPHCYGTGWKETHQDEVTQLGSGWRCVFCSGTGFVWVEAGHAQ